MNNFDFIKIIAELSKQRVDANRYMSEEERSYRKAGIDLTKELAKQYFEGHKQIVPVVAALIWDGKRFLICQRPANKARALLWEFVGGKVEVGETKEQALVRECREELNITINVGPVFMEVVHEYPDITVHMTLFNAAIIEGEPELLEHNDIRWITASEIPQYEFCPADKELLVRIIEISSMQ